MAEPRLNPRHLAAPRKLILLVRINDKGDYEAVTLTGEVALVGKSRDEIKEKMRIQVRQMKASVRPSTVRLHFLSDQRTWLHAPLPEEAEDGASPKPSADGHATTPASRSTIEKSEKSSQESSRNKANDATQKNKSGK